MRHTRARNHRGRYGVWGLTAFILLVHVSSLLGPAPTNTTAIGWACQLLWLPVLLAYWVDRNREVIGETRPASGPSTF